ncbi:MAG: Mth938-like domain-containing protein [Alphaproteobacteria bacterium]
MAMETKTAAGRQTIERYGRAMFRISGKEFQTSVIVLPERTLAWDVREFADIAPLTLDAAIADGGIDVLLLGCGPRMQMPAPELRAALKAHGIALEPMDTGAACRTYNLLAAEERRVAAALIALI